MNKEEFLAAIVIVGFTAFGLGVGLTALSYRRQIRYYRRMAAKWWKKSQTQRLPGDEWMDA